tara:strand:- start:280820 stop:282325 length:1506 start_codon:yes stop_codon:yes gene_type:complete
MASTDAAESSKLRSLAWEPIDSAILVYLRVAVGIAIFFWAKSFLDSNLYSILFIEPRFLFKYPGLEWVRLWPGQGIYWHFVVTMVAGVCMAIGFLTRFAAAILSFSISYVLLVECSIYVNHYYLLACVAGLFVFLPSDRCGSLDSKFGISRRQAFFPRWQLWLLRFQLGIPYVFGAIAKLNPDWFGGQPAGIILSRNAHAPVIGPWLSTPGLPALMSYGGLLYDLLIVPMLLYRRTRWLGIFLSLAFHLTNAKLLNIGVFPWFMLATLFVFLPPQTLRQIWNWLVGIKTDTAQTAQSHPAFASPSNRRGVGLAIIYVIVQLVLPIRPWVLPGNASWNERGQRFAWRMMLRDKVTLVHFLVIDSDTGEYLFLPSHTVLTANQMLTAERNPDLIRQAAVQLADLAAKLGTPQCRIHCLALVSLNGRRPQPMIDPTVDLLAVQRGWFIDDWVNVEPGPLPESIWDVEKERWWAELELPDPFKPLQGRSPEELRQFLESLETSVR